ncbi:MAG: hypothetical protein C4290_00790 [Chloroflexota bacterium]
MTTIRDTTADGIGGSAELRRYILHAPPSLNPRLKLWILSGERRRAAFSPAPRRPPTTRG